MGKQHMKIEAYAEPKDVESARVRHLQLEVPILEPGQKDAVIDEILSWDKNGDGSVDISEVRGASEALLRARKSARAWKKSFFLLAVAFAVFVGVLFAVTLATNELSKESTVDDGDDDDGDRVMRSRDGLVVATQPVEDLELTLFEIPTATRSELERVKKMSLPLSGDPNEEYRGSVSAYFRIREADDAESGLPGGYVTTLFLEGGVQLIVEEDTARLRLAPSTEVVYTRGPTDPDTGRSSILVVNSRASSTIAVNGTTLRHYGHRAPRHGDRILVTHAATGRRRLVRFGLEPLIPARRAIVGPLSVQVQHYPVPTIRKGAWFAPEPLPGHPSLTYWRCQEIVDEVGGSRFKSKDPCTKIAKYAQKAFTSCKSKSVDAEDSPYDSSVPYVVARRLGPNEVDMPWNWEYAQCARKASVSVCEKRLCKNSESYFKGSKFSRKKYSSACAALCDVIPDRIAFGRPAVIPISFKDSDLEPAEFVYEMKPPFGIDIQAQFRSYIDPNSLRTKFGYGFSVDDSSVLQASPLPCPGFDFTTQCDPETEKFSEARCGGDPLARLASICQPVDIDPDTGLIVSEPDVVRQPTPTPTPTTTPSPSATPIPGSTSPIPIDKTRECSSYGPCPDYEYRISAQNVSVSVPGGSIRALTMLYCVESTPQDINSKDVSKIIWENARGRSMSKFIATDKYNECIDANTFVIGCSLDCSTAACFRACMKGGCQKLHEDVQSKMVSIFSKTRAPCSAFDPPPTALLKKLVSGGGSGGNSDSVTTVDNSVSGATTTTATSESGTVTTVTVDHCSKA
eukprot:TRINITY_DN3743_c0_g1_i1.p1 TRINITY_DN3743_c0_g1~~TRINITY_DN3743_c0_g1_i1.p1  ORF type:complete len:797 (+),score=173.94 TRINITY_DN3743_c0_g1_i1:414-2804(+)